MDYIYCVVWTTGNMCIIGVKAITAQSKPETFGGLEISGGGPASCFVGLFPKIVSRSKSRLQRIRHMVSSQFFSHRQCKEGAVRLCGV